MPDRNPIMPPIRVLKAGLIILNISALSTSLAHRPSMNAITIAKTEMQRVVLTIKVTYNVSFSLVLVEFSMLPSYKDLESSTVFKGSEFNGVLSSTFVVEFHFQIFSFFNLFKTFNCISVIFLNFFNRLVKRQLSGSMSGLHHRIPFV